ncbi:MAG: TPMT family class I SAM-dependent methyltransferase [Chitinophagales bacterium]|nr:TPMT family class I SAM-dependent methyltransferase [Chitinophagales bacterium]
MTNLNASYWEQRYLDDNTPWDIGNISPPLKHYTDGIDDKSLRILIPGAGYAHEAIDLHKRGFTNVYVCDWAPSAFDKLRKQAVDFPQNHLLVEDFFKLRLEVDLILEQTFFCALKPDRREEYVLKAKDLLSVGGKLAGLLFAVAFSNEGPPFGGTKEEYLNLFAPHFKVLQMDVALDSISPRAERELFIELQKTD